MYCGAATKVFTSLWQQSRQSLVAKMQRHTTSSNQQRRKIHANRRRPDFRKVDIASPETQFPHTFFLFIPQSHLMPQPRCFLRFHAQKQNEIKAAAELTPHDEQQYPAKQTAEIKSCSAKKHYKPKHCKTHTHTHKRSL